MMDAVFIINQNKEVLYINISASLMTKLKPSSIIGKKSYEHLIFSDESLFCMKDGTNGFEKTSLYNEVELKTSKGIEIKVQTMIQPIVIADEEPLWMVYFHNVVDEINLSTSLKKEVEEREKTKKQISKVQSELQEYSELAFKDTMTGLGNFRFFEKEILKTIQTSLIENQPFSLVMMDVDKFKSFNDTYGHQQGDEVLRTIAKSISGVIRSTDIFARYGGEEFVLILKNNKISDVEIICEKIRSSVENTKVPKISSPGEFLAVTISLGAVSIDPLILKENNLGDYKQYLEVADKNLYSAKNGGRNRSVVTKYS